MLAAVLSSASCGDIEPESSQSPDPGLDSAYSYCGLTGAPTNSQTRSVFINEVFAGSFLDERADWFEIHNGGQTPVPLDGWTVEDRYSSDVAKTEPGHFEFPPGTTLCPGQFYVVVRDNGCEVDSFGFGIGNTDGLALMDSSGAIVDQVQWAELPQEQSVGRPNDEAGDFEWLPRLKETTQGFSNSEECECCGDCRLGRCTLRDGVCVADSEAQCIAADACLQLGWCGLMGDQCRATRPEHCQQSELCIRQGRCGLIDGTCEVVADADCQAAKVCENQGRCSADLESIPSRCIATSRVDCERSDDCTGRDDSTGLLEKARCTLDGDRCVATSCANTAVCVEKGCCTVVDGKCSSL